MPPEVKDVLFGVHQDSSSTFTAESATAYRIVQRVPAIYVYVISTNPTHASELVALFAGIPSLLYKLPAGDFLAGRKVTYPNMGVDRVANIAAAHFFYPSASAVLVIDGGTALTYTAAVPAAGSLQRQQLHPPQRLGGGIGAGLRMKFRSLFDYTNDLPHITPQQLTETVKECAEKKQPLPLIAISTGKNEDTDTMMARSVMGSVLTETALLLCSVIRGWLDKQNPTANSNKTTTNSKDILPAVVITGGDGEIYEMLLQPKHSHIVETNDANIALLEAGLHEQINDDNNKKAADANDLTAIHKRFRLHRHKYLPHHGIQYVLTSKMTVLANMSDDEYIRFQLIGQRVAVPSPVKKTQVVYGTIYSIIRNDVFDKDFYSVHYDESELIDDLEVTKIYGTLCSGNDPTSPELLCL